MFNMSYYIDIPKLESTDATDGLRPILREQPCGSMIS